MPHARRYVRHDQVEPAEPRAARAFWRGCVGKVRFPSRDKAVGRARAIVQKGDRDYATAYQCPHCGHWHLSLRAPRPRADADAEPPSTQARSKRR